MTTYQSTAYRVRQLFSTLAAATTSNPVLLEGERWHEKSATTGRFTGRTKTGDGVVTGGGATITGTAFIDLPFDPSTGGGASVSDATPQPLGTAAAGTGSEASRSDHRHAMPNAAQVGADAVGTAAAAVAAHAAAADAHPDYTTAQEAAAAAPVQSVAGRTGAVTLAAADVAGLGTAATTPATDYATAAQGAKADTAVQPAGLSSYVQTGDSRLSDAREWSAATATQAEAEAGSSTTRLAFTPLRVFQAIAAWWAASAAKAKLDGIASGATANSSDAQLRDRSTHTGTQAVGTITGLGTLATQSGTFSGTSSGTNTGDQDLSGLVSATTARTANTFLAGPTTGGAAAPVFRSLAPADLPVLTGFTSGAGTVSATDSVLQAIQKLDGNDRTIPTQSLAYNANTELDLATLTGTHQLLTLTGAVSFTAVNLVAGRWVTIFIEPGASNRTLTFPAGWVFLSNKPATQTANKSAVLSIKANGTASIDIRAVWKESP